MSPWRRRPATPSRAIRLTSPTTELVPAGPVELVIFDCDGVLIDSERLAVKVDVAALRELGWPLTEAEVIMRFMGRPDRETRALVEAHLGRPLPEGWAEQMQQRYRRAYAAQLKP